MIEIESINLDDISTDWQELRELSDDLKKLSEYAKAKSEAMEFRESGMIPQAIRIERHLESLYYKLPEHLRW